MQDHEISDITGLPAELGIDDALDKGFTDLTVDLATRRYGKPVTVVTGFGATRIDVEALASQLKRTLATGGTVKEGRIELQGDHVEAVEDLLNADGFQATRA